MGAGSVHETLVDDGMDYRRTLGAQVTTDVRHDFGGSAVVTR
ncbi:hypothetical protein O4328_42530 [Rhodococcus opacus]|uniref:Uncharacterized protein n=1 Tax=Rhodococcus opacus TaxID=37919 RepID=A0AAX3YV30_RHOOP|nr:hypothetical protein [Rhodococcus opacus]MCZ4590220.1 hypothetical protein [Rhodococcus opacus]WLF52321.1 hypothetical protein Q5707_43840 [Rhodococcus opacus]